MSGSTIPPEFVTSEHFDRSMGLVLDRLAEVRGGQLTGDQLQAAFAAGMRQAMTDRGAVSDMMTLLGDAAQQRATTAAGRGVWWVLKNGFGRWVMIVLLVLAAAKMFGWDAAAKLGKMLTAATQ